MAPQAPPVNKPVGIHEFLAEALNDPLVGGLSGGDQLFCDLIGIDHVGISSDFDGGGGIVGWNDASESQNVTVELVRRGYTEEEIAKLWGGNLLRVWREVERVAAELQEQT